MAHNRAREKKSGHISDEDIAAFVSGSLPARERNFVVAHLADCNLCRKIVSEAVASQEAVEALGKRKRGRAK